MSIRIETSHQHQVGMSLVELMIVIAILALIATIAVPSYSSFIDRTNIQTTIADLREIKIALERFSIQQNTHPDFLSQVGMDLLEDPWGNTYQYYNHATAKGKGFFRKDKALNPINSDYDLYSTGKDGKTLSALTAPVSQDDVIRAGNGGFHGLASDF